VALALITTVLGVLAQGWSRLLLVVIGGMAITLGGGIAQRLVARMSLSICDGTLTIRIPFRRDVSTPISAVARVIQIPAKPGSPSKALYRNYYALSSSTGSTLGLLTERSYRPDQLAAFLALLPAPEREATPLSLRDLWRSYRITTPISVRDVVLMGLSYLLLLGGIGLLVLGAY
jgi:hypothetical protein